jgi:hypothetical protein
MTKSCMVYVHFIHISQSSIPQSSISQSSSCSSTSSETEKTVGCMGDYVRCKWPSPSVGLFTIMYAYSAHTWVANCAWLWCNPSGRRVLTDGRPHKHCRRYKHHPIISGSQRIGIDDFTLVYILCWSQKTRWNVPSLYVSAMWLLWESTGALLWYTTICRQSTCDFLVYNYHLRHSCYGVPIGLLPLMRTRNISLSPTETLCQLAYDTIKKCNWGAVLPPLPLPQCNFPTYIYTCKDAKDCILVFQPHYLEAS